MYVLKEITLRLLVCGKWLNQTVLLMTGSLRKAILHLSYAANSYELMINCTALFKFCASQCVLRVIIFAYILWWKKLRCKVKHFQLWDCLPPLSHSRLRHHHPSNHLLREFFFQTKCGISKYLISKYYVGLLKW